MKCKECGKTLNNMTVICDYCGMKVTPVESPDSMEGFFNQIVVKYSENDLSVECKSNMKDIYYLTHEYKKAKGFKKHYLKKLIEMHLFRIFYETEKKYLLTKKYDPKDALLIFEALYNHEMNQEVVNYLKTIYENEMINYELPENIIKSFPLIYLNDGYKKVSSLSSALRFVLPVFKKSVKYSIIFGIFGFIVHLGLSSIAPSIRIPNLEEILILSGLFGFLLGIYPGVKSTKHIAIKRHMKENKAFRNHINKYAKDKIKSLKIRIKKGDV